MKVINFAYHKGESLLWYVKLIHKQWKTFVCH